MIYTFLSELFGHAEKRLNWSDEFNFQNSRRQNIGNKLLQCTYCPISQEVKVTDNGIWSVNRI